jgi:hypothetical protein
MALPIKPTPVLTEEEAEKFLKKVRENLDKPSHRRPTPKLSQAKELAIQHAFLHTK